jgi:hypothetical protein
MTTEVEQPARTSESADAVQGARPEDLSGRNDKVGNPAPQVPSATKPLTEEERLKAQGLVDEPDEATPDAETDDVPPVAWEGEYQQFNDESADSVVDMLKEAGVGARESNLIFKEAIDTDDLSKIKWDVLEERLGKSKARLAKIAIEDYYNRVYSRHVATTNAVHEEVGGKANWEKIAKWARALETRDPSKKGELDEIRKGLDAGGKLAIHVTRDLKAMYESDPKNGGLGKAKVQRGNTAPVEDAVGDALSRNQYLDAVKAAHKARAKPEVLRQLAARREAGRKRGI